MEIITIVVSNVTASKGRRVLRINPFDGDGIEETERNSRI